ncbi:conjugal transfer protein TraG N-terminal domain-containing protein [Sphingomonas xinjiangensis]|uniref:Conjugal transfer mating pair stabilization protein TraG n=1 Tax=Sphingomonas xinjiangensis TaxID=643568 RepID=A0A840YRI6_9SPHN|nr:conjugal transfer protein TraG N-terminal domain-containing protein [Sphingomonas xinjiangensis]MBB5712341.1 conjugal transfer mating pair stabilization protein TraG [Sphingomonas xinjiangensis]
MVEVFTIGGGEYIVNTFNAVAAWTGGGGYKSLIKVVLVIGFVYALLAVAFTMNVRAWLNWFLGSTLIYSCLMVPTVDVKVTDRINPSLAPATVANVPLGLATMASFTSQVGDYLTTTAETVFVMPSQLNYSTNGMIYGSRLFDATRNFQIRDAEFVTNLQLHFKQCVFGDIMLHQKSLTGLASSKDLWQDLGPGSAARSQPWLDNSAGSVTSSIITCRQAYDLLSSRWGPILDAHAGLWGKEAYPRLSTAVAAAKLRADVPIANTAFTGASSDYAGTMRQMSAINAFMQARDAMAGGAGSAAIDTFATTRADIQARNTYNSIAQQAMSWVPILNVVLTVVFYAMFPVIFPLFLMPQTGVAALKGYVTGFFYLASWGPLYVILHMICMSRGQSAAQGMAEGGVALNTFAGIGAVNAETATIAGFMLMSVPFIAGGLARGALSVSNQATSILAPAQNAAEAAALEQTTGNYSYGNVSFANSTSNMRQSNQYSDAPTFSTGQPAFSYRGSDGSVSTTFADGHTAIDSTPAISRLPFTPTGSRAATATEAQNASLSYRIAEGFERAAQNATQRLNSIRNSSVHSIENVSGNGSSSGSRSGTGTEARAQASLSERNSIENRASRGSGVRTHNDTAETTNYADTWSGGVGGQLSANAGLSAGAPGAGPNAGVGAGVTGKLGWDRSSTNADTTSKGRSEHTSVDNSVAQTKGISGEQSLSLSGSATEGTFSQAEQFKRSSVSDVQSKAIEETLSKIQSYTEQAKHYRELGRSLEQSASYSESNGFAISQNLSNELQEFYRKAESEGAGNGFLPPLHATGLDVVQEGARNAVIQRFLTERSNSIRADLQEALADPALKDMVIPDVGQAGDVEKLYRGGGQVGAPDVSNMNDGGPGSRSATFPVGRSTLAPLESIRDNGLSVKGSADVDSLDPRIVAALPAIASTAERLGLPDPVITSGNDSKHKAHSRHYQDQAVDLRANTISVAEGQQWAATLQRELGSGYFVQYEYDRKKPDNRHVHLQTAG